MKDERNKTGRIQQAQNSKELEIAHYWLEVRSGGGRSPILVGDDLQIGSDKTIYRIELDSKNREGFWIRGELTEVFQPLKMMSGIAARRPNAVASAVAKATGSH